MLSRAQRRGSSKLADEIESVGVIAFDERLDLPIYSDLGVDGDLRVDVDVHRQFLPVLVGETPLENPRARPPVAGHALDFLSPGFDLHTLCVG